MMMALKLPLNPSPLMKRHAVIACLTLLVSHGVCAQSSGTQALSKEDLNQINNQPLAPSSRNPAGLGVKEERKPSFEYTDPFGTQIREYRDSNLPTEIEVKSAFGTYEMSPPQTVFPAGGMSSDNLISVPSIRIPL
ncbi:MAG: hypothetical protein EBZ56_07975, partial [Burkholderiaceae bacterium]|nr:hypothetical protein [Burkholderiaceae bacterium]